jgi:hypothetical protein
MSALKTSLALLLCVSLSSACDDDTTQGDEFGGADAGGSISFPDAAPSVPDAAPPEPEPEPEPDPLGDLPVDLACTLDEIQPIFECVTENCLDALSDGTATTCIALNCGLLLLTLDPECSQCVLAGLSDPSSALEACVLGLDDLGGGFPVPPAP